MTEETKAPKGKKTPYVTKAGDIVRFRESFYDNETGLYDRGEVYTMNEGVTLPTRDVEYVKGGPAGAKTSELEEDEKPRKKAPAGAKPRKK